MRVVDARVEHGDDDAVAVDALGVHGRGADIGHGLVQ